MTLIGNYKKNLEKVTIHKKFKMGLSGALLLEHYIIISPLFYFILLKKNFSAWPYPNFFPNPTGQPAWGFYPPGSYINPLS